MNTTVPSITVVERPVGRIPFRVTMTGSRPESMDMLRSSAAEILNMRVVSGRVRSRLAPLVWELKLNGHPFGSRLFRTYNRAWHERERMIRKVVSDNYPSSYWKGRIIIWRPDVQ